MTHPGRRRRADSRYAEQAARLAARLRSARQHSDLTQEQLAARAQVAVATVRKIETGRVTEPGYFTVLALMEALGIPTPDPPPLPWSIGDAAHGFPCASHVLPHPWSTCACKWGYCGSP